MSVQSVTLSGNRAHAAAVRCLQKATGLLEKEENYVPRTRSYYKLPPASHAQVTDYLDIFEETPVYTLLRMLAMQAFGWQFYLFTNAMGNPRHPLGTNASCRIFGSSIFAQKYLQHFNPHSPLFKPHERKQIMASNLGLAFMTCVLVYYTRRVGIVRALQIYFVPYLVRNPACSFRRR
jgi:hypothetical protein